MSPVDGIHIFSPYQIGSLRILIAATVLLPLAIKNFKYLNRKNTFYLFFVGLCGNFLPSYLFPLAETKVQSSLAGLLNMGTSIFAVVIAWLFFKDKINRKQLIGFFLGVLGLFFILIRQIDSQANDFFYTQYILLATLCYAISLSLIKYKLQHLKPIAITSLAFFLMYIPSIISSLYTGAIGQIQFSGHAFTAFTYLAILSIIGTAIAVILFNQLVSISTPLFSSSVTYIMPVVALFLGLLDGETFNPVNLIWIAVIFIGVYLMSKKTRKQSTGIS